MSGGDVCVWNVGVNVGGMYVCECVAVNVYVSVGGKRGGTQAGGG